MKNLTYKFEENKLPFTLELPICESKVMVSFELHTEQPRIELIFQDESYIEIPFEYEFDALELLGFDMGSDGEILEDGVIVGYSDGFTWEKFVTELKQGLFREGILKPIKERQSSQVVGVLSQTFSK